MVRKQRGMTRTFLKYVISILFDFIFGYFNSDETI